MFEQKKPAADKNSRPLELGLHTTREAAAAFRCSTRTLRRWVAMGKLTPLRTSTRGGGKLLFAEAEIRRLIAQLDGRDV